MTDIPTGYTPGPWKVFICDDGREWTGWPLSITADSVVNANGDGRLIVRTGGQYPYQWDHGTSRDEAVANARLIAAAPDMAAEITSLRAEVERLRAALGQIAELQGELNPSNYTHDDVVMLNNAFGETWQIATAALTEQENSNG